MYEIKPLADGFGIYKDGVYVMWCADRSWAERRMAEMVEKEGK